jgi:hypothetical protein
MVVNPITDELIFLDMGTGREISDSGFVIGYDEFGVLVRVNINTGQRNSYPGFGRYGEDINNFGEFSSLVDVDVPTGQGKKTVRKTFAVRHNGSQVTWLSDPIEANQASINDDGDVAFCYSTSAPNVLWFYFSDPAFNQSYRLSDLVNDPFFDTASILTPHVSNRDLSLSLPLPVISGRAIGENGEPRIFFLFPDEPTPTPGITVSPTNGVVTSEPGGQDSFEVVLNMQPTADVTIGISSSDTSEGEVDVSSLIFTPANWDIPQTVTITGVDDAIEDGDVAYTIITAQAVSTDPDYNGLDANDVSVTNLDDDGPTGGGSETYSVLDDPNWQAIAIPDNNPNGISSTISVSDNHQITGLTVTLDINHQRPSDLEVVLTGPNGVQVSLTNFTGDNPLPDDYDGISSAGDWTLQVVDTRNRKSGTLNSWSITVDY